MRIGCTLGHFLIGVGGVLAWAALLGLLVPALDALASFMPIFGAMSLLGAVLAWRGRIRTLVLTVIAVAPVAMTVAPELLRKIPAAAPGAPQVRIVTHNVWVKNGDPAETAQVVLDARPDILLLQEVDGRFRPMLEALRHALPHATDCPPGCGFAIFSRWPIRERDYRLKDADGQPFGPPLLWARVEAPGLPPFVVLTVHYHWPLPAERQARERMALARALARIDRGSLIVAGDMNLTPWAAAMQSQDQALAPLTRLTRAMPSWRRPVPLLPIDHLYAGPGWGLVDARRLPATGSDHYPMLLILGRQ